MDALDQLGKIVANVARGLAVEMMAAQTDKDVLPLDEIVVEKTADGVKVKFIQRPSAKKAAKVLPRLDES